MENTAEIVILSDDEDLYNSSKSLHSGTAKSLSQTDKKRESETPAAPAIKVVPIEQLQNTDLAKSIRVRVTSPSIPNSNKQHFQPQIYYKKTPTGQRIKVVPKRHSIESTSSSNPVPASNSTDSTNLNINQIEVKVEPPKCVTPSELSTSNYSFSSEFDNFLDLIPKDSKFTSIDTSLPCSSTSSGAKRKSHPISLDGSRTPEDNQNTELMRKLACLRVSLNYLLDEMGLEKVKFSRVVGESKPLENVKKILEVAKKKESTKIEVIKLED